MGGKTYVVPQKKLDNDTECKTKILVHVNEVMYDVTQEL